MKIIVGLGNPGKKYKDTRHNAGFMAVDFLLGAWNLPLGSARGPELEALSLSKGELDNFQKNFSSLIWETEIYNQKVFLAKPQTFMNESGRAVKQLTDFYKLNVSRDLLIVHDDVDLPLGKLKLTPSASSAGHNGVQNLIEQLGTQDFYRIRIGVDTRNPRSEIDIQDFVLQNFTPAELKRLQEEVLPQAKKEIEKFLRID